MARAYLAIAGAGFRRYATYRQATFAATFTNSVFGFLRCFVLLTVASSAGGTAAGYTRARLATFVWVSQGLIGTVLLWGGPELAERIRSGDVVADLLRPLDLVWHQLAADLGRAAHAAVTRFAVPLLVGALAFDLYAPRHPVSYPLFGVSVLLATIICFGCRFMVNAAAYWLLDARGPQVGWLMLSSVLSGLTFPLRFLPEPLGTIMVWVNPIAAIVQTPLDVITERVGPGTATGLVAVQAGWAVLAVLAARLVQRRGERRLVVQGG